VTQLHGPATFVDSRAVCMQVQALGAVAAMAALAPTDADAAPLAVATPKAFWDALAVVHMGCM